MSGPVRVRPTAWGIAVVAALVLVLVVGVPVGEPALAGTVWATVAGVVVVGAVWPVVALARCRVVVRQAPTDVVVGRSAELQVELAGGSPSLQLRVGGGPGAGILAAPGSTAPVPWVPADRSVVDAVEVEATTDAPFAVVRARRRWTAPLPSRCWVVPVPVEHGWEPTAAGTTEGGASGTAHRWGGDTVRTVRPYEPGDPAHLVHWPSSARAGALLVRELEPPALFGLAVVVDLTGGRAGAEVAASHAAGLVAAVLEAGGAAMLCTAGTDGPRRHAVTDPVTAGRRLAEAVAGPPATPPPGWPVEVVAAAAVDAVTLHRTSP